MESFLCHGEKFKSQLCRNRVKDCGIESGFGIVCISSSGVSQFHAPASKSVRETGKQLENSQENLVSNMRGKKVEGFHMKRIRFLYLGFYKKYFVL